ncbi:MAG TPA: ABC transporter substrate-binding protein [Amycolatopsis sp.]|nr:ABC transporter substrate-binding protein [Amycolatopsis sp.]
MRRSGSVRLIGLASAAALMSATIACGANTGSGSGQGLPDKIDLVSVQDLSGTSGPGGQSTKNGMDTAIKEINETKFLGNTQLALSYEDSATDPAKGASKMSQTAAGGTPLVFGSFTSATALAEAPIAQKAKLPTIFTQAGASGLLDAGDYIYRATPLQTSYFNKTLEYLQSKGVKKASLIYDTDVPTIVDLAHQFQDSSAKYGFTVAASEATTSKQVDVSSQISKLLAPQPDAIFVDVLLAHNVQVIKQLRQAGYRGLIVAQQGAGGGVLKPLGADADGVVLANDFNPLSADPGSQHFTQRYQAQFNELPGNFSAEGYDAVWLAARAIKQAGSADRAKILQGLQTVAQQGFDGALGKITFQNRQEVTPGVLVEIRGGAETPVKAP